MAKRFARLIFLICCVGANTFARASHFEFNTGVGFGVGQLENSSMDVPARTMSAFAIEVFPGYRVNKFLIGVDANVRWNRQLTSLSKADGTNFKGQASLVGLGLSYDITPQWALFAALDFIGTYALSKKSDADETVTVTKPIALRVKGQYLLSTLPLSLDLNFEVLQWGRLTAGSDAFEKSTTQWLIGAGLTYHFGQSAGETAKNHAEPVSSPPAPRPKITP